MMYKEVFSKLAAIVATLLASGVAMAQSTPTAAAKNATTTDIVSTEPESAQKPDDRANAPGGSGPERADDARLGQPTGAANATPSDVGAGTVLAPPASSKGADIPVQVPKSETSPSVKQDSAATPAPKAILPLKLSIGKGGWLQVGALLQGWFDTQWRSELPAGASRNTQATFRIRRAEIKVAGDILRDVASFLVSFDPASTYKYNQTNYTVTNGTGATANAPASQTIITYAPPGNTAALKLFWVTLKSPYVDASLGQFKYPFGYEGQSSSAELTFPERGYSTRYFGDTYDMGIRLEKKFDWLKYQVFLINGSGQNQLDTNLQKDLAVRLEFTPFEGLVLGTSGLTSLAQRTTQATTKDRIEVFGRFNKSGVLLQSELLWGESGTTASGTERTKAAGRYVIGGYTIAGKLQPVVRYGYLNTDKTVTLGQNSSYALFSPFGVASDEVRSYEAGLNYYLQGNELKLQAAYGYFDFDNVPSLQEFTVAAQSAF